MSDPLYVIPDIHGQRAMLETALDLIERDGGQDARIIFLGDYVDRGPDSRGVLDMLIEAQSAGRNWIALRGNHDQMFLDFLDRACIDNPRFSNPGFTWLHDRLGGRQTLASYGVEAYEDSPSHAETVTAVPRAHRDWLAGLRYFLVTPQILFVHAGIVPGVPLEEQNRDDMIWIRKPFHLHTAPHPWLVVHGHTALEQPRHFGNRIDLDGGAGWGRPLCPAVFEGRDCWLLTDTGREPLLSPD